MWTAPDTANGIIYYGATYVAPDSTPLAVQFWAPAFRRDFGWIVAALAHEAYHALHPSTTEEETLEFGESCASHATDRRPNPAARGLTATAGSL